jgi:hypothetical protein
MKSFKQCILETTEQKPLSGTFFIHKDGKLIEPTRTPLESQFADHVHIAFTQPHDFGMTQDKMDDLTNFSDQEKLQLYKTGRAPYEGRIFHQLSEKGFIKGVDQPSDYKTHKIILGAATGSHDTRHGIKDMSEAIRTLRSKIPEGHQTQMFIEGLKYHTSTDLGENPRTRLSEDHIKSLLSDGRVTFQNVEELDRFLGNSTKVSRDPGSGIDPIPSPEQMRRKAGDTGEPPSIQGGRFFQSDSYNHMKSFKQFISEDEIQPVTPVVPIQPDPPKRKQPYPKPGEKETELPVLPVREPDRFDPTRDFPEFKPYKRNAN